jgi:hypothetical protein
MATTPTCQICGQQEEDSFHIFFMCPHARALWLAMKEVWELPPDVLLKPTSKEWGDDSHDAMAHMVCT